MTCNTLVLQPGAARIHVFRYGTAADSLAPSRSQFHDPGAKAREKWPWTTPALRYTPEHTCAQRGPHPGDAEPLRLGRVTVPSIRVVAFAGLGGRGLRLCRGGRRRSFGGRLLR